VLVRQAQIGRRFLFAHVGSDREFHVHLEASSNHSWDRAQGEPCSSGSVRDPLRNGSTECAVSTTPRWRIWKYQPFI
jgi:hypothetical protein